MHVHPLALAEELPVLVAAAVEIEAEIKALASRDVDERARWCVVGAALLRARDATPNTLAFGAWVVRHGIHKLPGLASAGSRSDCIWLVERAAQADLIPPGIVNPRAIRRAWRKLLAAEAAAAVADLSKSPAIRQVMKKTAADIEEATLAVEAAMAQAEAAGAEAETSPEHAAFVKATKKAAKVLAGETMLGIVSEVTGTAAVVIEVAAPGPLAAKADIDGAVTAAAAAGVPATDLYNEFLARLAGTYYVSADMAAEMLRAAMTLAKERAMSIDDVKDMAVEVHWN